jgi:hypothetical protein
MATRSGGRGRHLVPAVLVALLAAPALADGEAVMRHAEHRFEIELASGPWREVPIGEVQPVAGWMNDELGAVLAITRVDYPNADAWRGKDRFFEEVEAGVREHTEGYRRLGRRTHKLGRVPAMDLTFRHQRGDGHEVVLTRFIFFRTYSLALTVAVPGEAYGERRRQLARLVSSFQPYFAD